MSVKIEVLKKLEENREVFFSGEILAKELNVSRASVWKAINQLKKEGYNIEAISNKGYCLSKDTDVISKEGILPYLKDTYKKTNFHVYKSVESTNKVAKEIALKEPNNDSIIVSEEQTLGRGRLGRKFFSPEKTGIYMSMLIHPDINLEDATLITTATSVAVSRAIQKVTGIKTTIKWVNDIFIKNRKVAGILTEAATNFESGKIDWVIIGVGINFNTPLNSFPEDLKEIATSIFEERPDEITRNRLIGEIINEVMALINPIDADNFMEEYKEKSMVIGKDIIVKEKDNDFIATAIDIDRKGQLIIRCKDGEVKKLHSGEISIRTL